MSNKQEIAEKLRDSGLFEWWIEKYTSDDPRLVGHKPDVWPTADQSEALLAAMGLVALSFEDEFFIAQEDGAEITGSGVIMRFKKIVDLDGATLETYKQAALAHDEVLVKRFDELKTVIEEVRR